MKKACLFILTIILLFSLTSCGLETAKQHDKRSAKEAESIKDAQEAAKEAASETTTENTSSAEATTTAASAANTTKENTAKQTTASNGNTAGQNNSGTNTNTNGNSGTTNLIKVYLTVKCNNVLNQDDLKTSAILPSDGYMLKKTEIWIAPESTVLDVMNTAQSLDYIKFTLKDAVSGYITSINTLSEGSCGTRSGWKYAVNNNPDFPSAKLVTVKSGDDIIWYYALNENDKNF
jgi:hypothetical protein